MRKLSGKILLPPPPSEEKLVRELSEIRRRRKKYVPNKIRDLELDYFSVLFARLLGIPESKVQMEMNSLVPIIKKHKNYFNLDRPHQLAKKHGVPFDHDYHKVPSAHTKSYPSGHTTQAYYLALLYSEQFPGKRNQLMALAKQIENARIDRGLHFPSDNKAAIKLAHILFKRKKSTKGGPRSYLEKTAVTGNSEHKMSSLKPISWMTRPELQDRKKKLVSQYYEPTGKTRVKGGVIGSFVAAPLAAAASMIKDPGAKRFIKRTIIPSAIVGAIAGASTAPSIRKKRITKELYKVENRLRKTRFAQIKKVQ